jgi:hypothetical protein
MLVNLLLYWVQVVLEVAAELLLVPTKGVTKVFEILHERENNFTFIPQNNLNIYNEFSLQFVYKSFIRIKRILFLIKVKIELILLGI